MQTGLASLIRPELSEERWMSYTSPALSRPPILQNEGPSEYLLTDCLLDTYVSSPAFPCQPSPLPTYSLPCLVPFQSSLLWEREGTGVISHGSHCMALRKHGTSQPCGEAQPENKGQMECMREEERIPEELPERRLGITSGRLKRLLSKNTSCL